MISRNSPARCKIMVLPDLAALSERAAMEFARLALRSSKARRCFTVALAGGSTPMMLYSLLSDEKRYYRYVIPWKWIHFFWGDERCVPFNHPDSNYGMAFKTLLGRVPVPPRNIHPIPVANGDGKRTAQRYAQIMRRHFRAASGGIPKFDLILLGMGEDGHIASLFPGSEALRESRKLVCAVRGVKAPRRRITLTLPVLNNAANIIFLVSGKTKSKSLTDVFLRKNSSGRHPLPAGLVRAEHGKRLWLLDSASAT